jgi:hypothetical protein
MHPSLFATFVAAAEYPDVQSAMNAGSNLHALVSRSSSDSVYDIALKVIDSKFVLVIVATSLLPENLEKDVVTLLSLDPGKFCDASSDVVAAVMQEGFDARQMVAKASYE